MSYYLAYLPYKTATAEEIIESSLAALQINLSDPFVNAEKTSGSELVISRVGGHVQYDRVWGNTSILTKWITHNFGAKSKEVVTVFDLERELNLGQLRIDRVFYRGSNSHCELTLRMGKLLSVRGISKEYLEQIIKGYCGRKLDLSKVYSDSERIDGRTLAQSLVRQGISDPYASTISWLTSTFYS